MLKNIGPSSSIEEMVLKVKSKRIEELEIEDLTFYKSIDDVKNGPC